MEACEHEAEFSKIDGLCRPTAALTNCGKYTHNGLDSCWMGWIYLEEEAVALLYNDLLYNDFAGTASTTRCI
ncbi:hypothetical protein WAI453_000408 [Rhynchosporium graminicola]